MIKIYEAANGAEGHLILNLLQQAGLNARVDGEYLQGGIGDLQISGLVRVMIDQSDYNQGMELIEEWRNTDVDGMTNEYDASKIVYDEILTDKVKEPLI